MIPARQSCFRKPFVPAHVRGQHRQLWGVLKRVQRVLCAWYSGQHPAPPRSCKWGAFGQWGTRCCQLIAFLWWRRQAAERAGQETCPRKVAPRVSRVPYSWINACGCERGLLWLRAWAENQPDLHAPRYFDGSVAWKKSPRYGSGARRAQAYTRAVLGRTDRATQCGLVRDQPGQVYLAAALSPHPCRTLAVSGALPLGRRLPCCVISCNMRMAVHAMMQRALGGSRRR